MLKSLKYSLIRWLEDEHVEQKEKKMAFTLQRFIFFLALTAVSQMIVLSSLLWPLIWRHTEPAERISLQTSPKHLWKVWEGAPHMWTWDQANAGGNIFLFLPEHLLASGKGEIGQILARSANNKKKKTEKEPRMFTEVWKPSCVIPVLNARCPKWDVPFPVFFFFLTWTLCVIRVQTALWDGISHHDPTNETGLFVWI